MKRGNNLFGLVAIPSKNRLGCCEVVLVPVDEAGASSYASKVNTYIEALTDRETPQGHILGTFGPNLLEFMIV